MLRHGPALACHVFVLNHAPLVSTFIHHALEIGKLNAFCGVLYDANLRLWEILGRNIVSGSCR